MHEYTKRIPIRSNLSTIGKGYNYLDIDNIVKNIRHDNVNNLFVIKNSGYEMYVYIVKLTEHSKTLTLNIDIYDEDANNIEPREALKLFESISDFRSFIRSSINKYIETINNLQLKVHYFEEFDEAYDVHNNKLYAAIYNFQTNKFLSLPEVKEDILQFEEPNVDRLIEQILKE